MIPQYDQRVRSHAISKKTFSVFLTSESVILNKLNNEFLSHVDKQGDQELDGNLGFRGKNPI